MMKNVLVPKTGDLVDHPVFLYPKTVVPGFFVFIAKLIYRQVAMD